MSNPNVGGLSSAQQAALFTIALILVGIGAVGASDAVAKYGFPPSVGFVFIIAGIVGASLEKGYALSQVAALKIRHADVSSQLAALKLKYPQG